MNLYQPQDAVAPSASTRCDSLLRELLLAALIGAAFTGVAYANYHLLVWLNP